MPETSLFSIENLRLGHTLTSGQQQPVLTIQRLNINIGEKVALLGVSGAGKSTLLDYLYRQQPQSIAYCPQQLGLVPILSTFHNIYMGELQRHSWWYNLLNLVWPQQTPRDNIRRLAQQVGIEEKLLTSVDQLSGGQQQRVGLARALNQHSAIFLGDEPVSAIDPIQGKELIHSLNNTHETVIVALHDKEMALSCFDRIVGIKAGHVMLDAPTSTLNETQLDLLYQQS